MPYGHLPSPVMTIGTEAAAAHRMACSRSATARGSEISSRWLPSADTPLKPAAATVEQKASGSSFQVSTW